MEIKEGHKRFLKLLGLKDEDFKEFDGRFVSYEYDEKKGVRLYDPYYKTSFKEYIEVSGWSAWSSEEDTFMSDIIVPAREEVEKREKRDPGAMQEEVTQSLKKRFGKQHIEDPEE